ncbi:hypothetical protein AB9E07_35435, partial [Rhizobium leguminosarum]
ASEVERLLSLGASFVREADDYTVLNDPIFVGEGDIDAAREIVEKVEDAELFLYPGDQNYFADSSLPSYDADATALLTLRVIEFLNR